MTTTAHVPPQNIEAEESVLGAILTTESALAPVIDESKLIASDFYLDRHAAIFTCMRDLRAAGKPVDELTVNAALTGAQREQIEKAGGKAEDCISELAAKVAAPGSAKHHAEIVRDHSTRRAKIEIGRSLTNGLTPSEGIERLRNLESRRAGGGVRRADLSRVRPIRWLWSARVPLGYFSLILGAEGVGKGVAAAWIMARLSRGQLPGDLVGAAARILVVADEDGFDSIWVPRLHAAGADLDMVDTLAEGDDDLDVGRDADRLRGLTAEHGYKLVFLDALLDTLGVDVDDWRSKAVRDALRPLRRVAREAEVSMLGSLHPNKGQRGSFRDLVSGSHAFNASSRSSLLLAPHPDDEKRRILVRGKGNLSAAPPSFEFSIEGRELEINGHHFSLPLLTSETEGDIGIEDVVKPQREAPVRDTLADEIDALGTGEIQTRAEIAKALDRESSDASVGRALNQLEDQDRWEKVGRGKWRRIVIATHKGVAMSQTAEVEGLGVAA